MLDIFFFGALPYVALFVLLAGSIWRYRTDKFSYSALSSQFLESRSLPWGSIPWHVGILVILLGHIVALGFPRFWQAAVAIPAVLFTVEIVGLACTLLCIAGLGVLITRRITSGHLQSVTTVMDFAVLGLLFIQILLGLWMALAHRWGAAWGPAALSPYLWSLITLRPNLEYVTDMPGLVKLHIAGAWLLILVIPFSRLVHIFSLPIEYLWRAPQKVVWNSHHRFRGSTEQLAEDAARRSFLKAGVGITAGGTLLTIGTADKLVRYFKGPDMSPEDEANLLSKKIDRLTQTAEQRAYEHERMTSSVIRVARLAELEQKKGKYFIDYQMNPALAFLGSDGLPLLISAKCTHLGCTVASDLDNQGRILCPCHISYFDVQTGRPEGGPATIPLPRIGWLLMDPDGNTLLSESPSGVRRGEPDPEALKDAVVYIARHFDEERVS